MGFDLSKVEDYKLHNSEIKLSRKLLAVQNQDDKANIDLAADSMNCIRTFLKYAMGKIYVFNEKEIFDDSCEQRFLDKAKGYCGRNAKYRFIYQFHEDVQGITHVSIDEYLNRRLFNKYIPNLIKIKHLFYDEFAIELFKDIVIYPFELDLQFTAYYSKIIDVVNSFSISDSVDKYTGVYYVEKKRFIYVNEPLYELTLVQAYDKKDKFNRFIVFTKIDVMTNYCITAKIMQSKIKFLDTDVDVTIKVLTSYSVKIRNIELQNIEKLLNLEVCEHKNNEYKSLMVHLKERRVNLVDFIDMDDSEFYATKEIICEKAKVTPIFNILEYIRKEFSNKRRGTNLIRYLLYKLRNVVLNDQFPTEEKPATIAGTNITKSSQSFDEVPYFMDPKGHITNLSDLFECINIQGHEQELLARKVKELSDETSVLYVPIDSLNYTRNVDADIDSFNKSLYFKNSSLMKLDDKHIFIKNFEDYTICIFNRLNLYEDIKHPLYNKNALNWLTMNPDKVYGNDKRNIIPTMFSQTSISIIYGPAGTGKSTLIDFTLDILRQENVIGLAYTNSALDNLRLKLNQPNMEFKTIRSFIEGKCNRTEFDVVVIDECSTLSNKDMYELLCKIKFKYIILTGDTYQIPSINFGNWFSCAMEILPSKCIHFLKEEHRASDNKLTVIWSYVRDIKPGISEKLSTYEITKSLSNDIFIPKDPNDEIILCLNYDGIYGINNINLYLQSNNKNVPVAWDGNIYKVGDPILFNDLKRFDDLLYNNLKGKILDIKKYEDCITFTLEVNRSFNNPNIFYHYLGFEHVTNLSRTKSQIKITIYNKPDNYYDGQAREKIYMMPFQVAYAVSIHKSQGLEYNSVKVIINDDTDELISHNIFYTAITRARKYLNIYWSAKSERNIIDNFKLADHHEDAQLLKLRLNKSKD